MGKQFPTFGTPNYLLATKMANNETMMEQIRRLNEQEAHKHELRKQEALNKIRELRRAQREQAERHHDERHYETRS